MGRFRLQTNTTWASRWVGSTFPLQDGASKFLLSASISIAMLPSLSRLSLASTSVANLDGKAANGPHTIPVMVGMGWARLHLAWTMWEPNSSRRCSLSRLTRGKLAVSCPVLAFPIFRSARFLDFAPPATAPVAQLPSPVPNLRGRATLLQHPSSSEFAQNTKRVIAAIIIIFRSSLSHSRLDTPISRGATVTITRRCF